MIANIEYYKMCAAPLIYFIPWRFHEYLHHHWKTIGKLVNSISILTQTLHLPAKCNYVEYAAGAIVEILPYRFLRGSLKA